MKIYPRICELFQHNIEDIETINEDIQDKTVKYIDFIQDIANMTSSSERTALVVNGIFSITFLILAVLITIYHLVSTFKATSNLCSKTFLSREPSIGLSYILLFVSCISGISLTSDSLFTTELCSSAQYYGPNLYSLFKTIIYLILCCRIYISFRESMWSYNTKGLIIWSVLLIIWTLFNLIINNLTVTSKITNEEGNTKCLVNPSIIYIISQALLDIISGAINCYLFVRPICQLYKLTNDNIIIKTIAYKQCILSLIAIISSIIAMTGIGNVPSMVPVFVSFDMLISTLCVVLMYKWNSYVAESIFCCCMPKKVKNEMEIEIDGKGKVASKTGNSGNSNETTTPNNKHHTVTVATNKQSIPPIPSTIAESQTENTNTKNVTITVMNSGK